MLTPLYQPTTEPMCIVALMSGSGTNLQKILEHQHEFKKQWGHAPYQVVAIFTDNAESNATRIGKEANLPVVVRDIAQFYAWYGIRKTMKTEEGRSLRAEFDQQTVRALQVYDAQVAAYAGYMSAASPVLVHAYLGVNVHPADLAILDAQGERKYRGAHAVRDAILAGEQELRSSTHLIAEKVDEGPVLMVSAPLPVVREEGKPLEQLADKHQDGLKQAGDWKIFPLTLLHLAEGRFAKDESGLLHFDGEPIPNGLRLG